MDTLKTEGFVPPKKLALKKRTIAHLNASQMASAGGGGVPPQSYGGETCICQTDETRCDCTTDTTGDTGITPAPGG